MINENIKHFRKAKGMSQEEMAVKLNIKNEIVSIALVGFCMLASVVILYRNLALLTSITTDELKIGVLRTTTIFNIVVLVVGIIFAVFVAFDVTLDTYAHVSDEVRYESVARKNAAIQEIAG